MRWTLLHKYLSDECTLAERQKVETWLREDPERQAFMQSIHKIWDVKPRSEGRVNVKNAWKRFQTRYMEDEDQKFNPHPSFRVTNGMRRSRHKNWYKTTFAYKMAAAIVFLIAVGYVINANLNKEPKITYQKIVTADGERTNLRFSDGTQIKLNAHSTLKIPSNYGEGNRTLYLEGEAFFHVKHDPSEPFRVYTGDVYTKDIGTQFNIRAFPKDSSVTVVVVEGQVSIKETKNKNKKPVLLSDHERALISKGNIFTTSIADLNTYTGWKNGTLVFNDTRLSEVAKQLERWYGVKCILKDKKLSKQRLTASFQREPLSNITMLIEKSMNIDVTRNKRTVIFSAK